MASKELVISQSRHETKVAILEDGQLVEVYFQRANEYSLAGSIHKGRVTRVLPGMQSAFVDLGLERDTFLYVSDFFDEHGEEYDKVATSDDRGRGRGRDRDRDRDRGRDRGGERPEAPVEPLPEVRGFEEPAAAEAAAPPEAKPPEEAAPAPVQQPPMGQDQNRDRRGRRSRRRRRGGRGFPESKYVAAPGSEPVNESEAEPVEEPIAEAAREEDVILLPGESLAKYRRRGTHLEADEVKAAPAPVEEPEAPVKEAAIEEPVLPDGPTAAEVAEEVLDRVERLEAEAVAPVVETMESPGRAVSVEPQEIESEAIAEEADIEEAEEEGSTEEEAPVDEAATEEEPAAEERADEVEPARMPQSLTATLRAQGGRFPHRVNRRMRRRGGGRGGPIPNVAPPIAEPEPAEEVSRPQGERPERPRTPLPSIAELLKEGQEIIVQIAKEPLGQKGARITSHIALPGRYVVYMPTVEHLGVSRKISTEDERLRLKRILQKHREGMSGGFIMRTAGEGKSEDDIAADMHYLGNLWLDIRTKAEKRRAPALLHHDVEVVERILRDHLTEGFKAVWVDNEELYQSVLHGVERMQPGMLSRVKLYTRVEPIFDAFGITQELEKALRPKVWLKSGGYIVINQTEALVAVDVNTGKYVGKSNRLEDTIVKTNIEAVKEISRQVRLRDLGGIIVVDFIDMDERKNRQKVMQALEDAMRSDKAPYKILQFNDFGLVAITRKRVKQSLERSLCAPCPYCEGAGYVKSVQTVMGEILNQAQKYAKVVDTKDCILRVNPEVAKVLKSVENKYLEELEEVLGRPVMVIGDANIHQEKFDLT